MTYIYIFEDGCIGWSLRSPTPTDLLCISSGLLTVLAVPNLFLYEIGVDGERRDDGVAECRLDADPETGLEYHTL